MLHMTRLLLFYRVVFVFLKLQSNFQFPLLQYFKFCYSITDNLVGFEAFVLKVNVRKTDNIRISCEESSIYLNPTDYEKGND